jgi:4-hydroxy-2-oxoheptanedioate aldolase
MVVSGCSRVVGLAHGSDSGVPRTAVAELEATLAEDGVDGIYVGPRDLSYSLGCPLDPDDPVLKPALERIRSACAAAGKPAGIHASDGTTARRYRDGGCSLVTVATDALAISRGAAAELAAAQG